MGLFTSTKPVSAVGSLFNRQVKLKTPVLDLDADPGLFYELHSEEGEFAGHALFRTKVKAGVLALGPRIPLPGMYEMRWVLNAEGQRCGFLFTSQFQVENHGGYLLTYISNAAGKATTAETVAKTDDLVVYNYPNRGTLVVSTRINEAIGSVFEEQ